MASPDLTRRVGSPNKPSLPTKPDFPASRLRQKKSLSVNMGTKPPVPPKRSSSRASDRKRGSSNGSGVGVDDKNLPPDGAIVSKVDVNGNHGRRKTESDSRTTQLEQDFFTPGNKTDKDVDGCLKGHVSSAGHEHVVSARDDHVVSDAVQVESPTESDRTERPDKLCAKIKSGYTDGLVLTKPVIDVKLVKDDSKVDRSKDRASMQCNFLSKPTEELYPVVSDLHDLSLLTEFRRGMPARSSFFADSPDPEKTNDSPDGAGIYESFGDVQTLLKHSKKEDEHTYSLPQPQCYSDSTIKAVKVITEKYDTLQRMKAHAMSFRTGTKPRSPSSPASPVPSMDTTQPPLSNSLPEAKEEVSVVSEEFEEALQLTAEEMGLSKKEVCRLEMFYGSHAAQVVVCRCAADLVCGPKSCTNFDEWQPLGTGIPVLVLNTGLGKRPRQLLIVLADRNTGFPVWDDQITYLTSYTEEKPDFHTLCLSRNLTKMAGLKLNCPDAADMFMDCFKELTSDPLDDLWKVSSGGRRKRPKGKKAKSVKKGDISQPCNFYHITNLDLANELSMKMLTEVAKTKETAGLAQKDRTSVIVS